MICGSETRYVCVRMYRMFVVQTFVFPNEETQFIKTNSLSSQYAVPEYEQSSMCTVLAEFTYDEGHSFITPVLHLCLCRQLLIHVARHKLENHISENMINW